MVVLSVFDGMSCGQIALKELNIKVTTYYASEIDKFAMQQTQHNFSNTIQLGDITKIKARDLKKIDLFIGGSPCQGFSFAGKQLNFNDPRSKLFFEFVRLWNEIKLINPNALFLLENVNMKKEYLRVISEYMGVFPVRINSNLVFAQNRDRLYWTNIKTKSVGLFSEQHSDIPQPKNQNIFLKDILQPETEISKKYYLSDKMLNYFEKRSANFNSGIVNIRSETDKASTITASCRSIDISDNFIKVNTLLKPALNQNKSGCLTAGAKSGGLHSDMDIICVAMRGRNSEQPSNRAKGIKLEQTLEAKTDGKTNCLTSVAKDNLIVTHSLQPRNGKGIGGKGHLSKTDQKSYCLDTKNGQAIEYKETDIKDCEFTKNYLQWDVSGKGYKSQQDRAFYENGKHGSLTTCNGANKNGVLRNNLTLRRLTPVECARLQTIPDWYKWIVSDTQIYKMLGNGWTVEVIKHIFSFITPNPCNL